MPETLPAEGRRCLRLTRTTRSKNLKQGACGAALNAPTKHAPDKACCFCFPSVQKQTWRARILLIKKQDSGET